MVSPAESLKWNMTGTPSVSVATAEVAGAHIAGMRPTSSRKARTMLKRARPPWRGGRAGTGSSESTVTPLCAATCPRCSIDERESGVGRNRDVRVSKECGLEGLAYGARCLTPITLREPNRRNDAGMSQFIPSPDRAGVVFLCDGKAVGARRQKGLRRVFSGKRAGLRGARFSSGGSKGACFALAETAVKAVGEPTDSAHVPPKPWRDRSQLVVIFRDGSPRERQRVPAFYNDQRHPFLPREVGNLSYIRRHLWTSSS